MRTHIANLLWRTSQTDQILGRLERMERPDRTDEILEQMKHILRSQSQADARLAQIEDRVNYVNENLYLHLGSGPIKVLAERGIG
jgi:hypothetical protein